jgi:hypothetical protein
MMAPKSLEAKELQEPIAGITAKKYLNRGDGKEEFRINKEGELKRF